MLSDSLTDFVPKAIRERGQAYFASRRVRILEGDAWSVQATVRGSQAYEVTLLRQEDEILARCTCPFGDEHFDPCKHIWATLLAADEPGYLTGDGRRPVRNLMLLDGEDDLDVLPSDAFPGAVRPLPASPSPGRGPGTKPSGGPRPAPDAWKAALAQLQATPELTTAASSVVLSPGQELIYIVDRAATLARQGLILDVATRQRRKDGGWSKSRSRRVGYAEIAQLPDPADRRALSILAGGREQQSQSYYGGYGYLSYAESMPSRLQVASALSELVLPILCGTGRCLLRESETAADDSLRPLRWDDAGAWEFWLSVAPGGPGQAYAISGELRRGEERMPIERPSFLLSGGLVFWEDQIAPLRDSGAFPWIALLRQRGILSVPEGQTSEFLAELHRLPNLPRLELPEELRYEEVVGTPRPALKIQRSRTRGWSAGADPNRLAAELSFDYEGYLVAAQSPAARVFEPERRRMLRRDPEAEQAFLARLVEVGVRRRNADTPREELELPARILPKVARTLLQEGWRVEAQGKLYREAGDFRIEVTSGIDWFELHGGASFGDHEVPLATLLAALRRGEDLVPLGDGSFGLLPEEWLKKYVTLAGMGTPEEDHLRFRKTQVGLLDVLLAEQPEVRFDRKFERAREHLQQFQGVLPADPPAGFRGELRGYQRDGLGWLHFLREFGFGGCLADDMGLGKTIQVLALLEARRELRAARRKRQRPQPSLVVVPKSLVFNWKQEAARFAPQLRLLDHTGLGRGRPGELFDQHDVILTTYGTLRRDIVELKDYAFDYAILDEAQAIKNAGSQSAKAARLIQAEHRLALSGTPVENHLGELWSLFEFLNPGMLGTSELSGKADLGARQVSDESRTLLARALRPYLLRRTKQQVASDLPAKTEQTIYCDLEPADRKLYDGLRDHYRSALLGRIERSGIKSSKIQILEALLRLRQAACHPGLVDKARRSGESSSKIDMLLQQLREVCAEGHKSLVFSQFTSLLAIVRQRLDAEHIPYTYLDGRTRDREERVKQFQEDPGRKVFLISLKAGGVGLNLTAADYIFLLDPWWNPAVEAQAIDRAHRIGQSRPVFAYRLIARDTVEEKVLQLQVQKRDLAEAILTADNSLIRDLGREDLELLLS